MRPSCGQCEFKSINRPTDITLGDFWGVKLYSSDDDTYNGVSAVMVHSGKGAKLLDRIQDRIFTEIHNTSDMLTYNLCLNTPAFQSEESPFFYNTLKTIGFFETIQVIKERKK
jgi:hypothetical protein